MIRKVILAVLLGFLLTSTSIFAKDWSKIRIVTEGAYPPFNYVNKSGELEGFEIDLIKAFCEELKAKCSLAFQNWDGIFPALLAHKYDAVIASVSITEERKKRFYFSEKYFDTPTRFVAKKGKFNAKNFDANGKKLGVQRATIFHEFLDANFPNSKIKLYGTIDEALLDLKTDRLDVVMSDGLQLLDGFLNKPDGKDYEFVGKVYTDPKWFGAGIGVVVHLNNKDLAHKFNEAITSLREKGIYQKISKKWFGVDIYNVIDNP